MGEIILRKIEDKSCKEPSIGKTIDLKIEPPAVLGRGPILKCPDKKVSRNQATIDWDDEGVLITSTHVNPTFIIINGKEKTLSQGQSAVLNDGDKFGLLGETYWYKVVLKVVNENSTKNVATKEDSLLPTKDKKQHTTDKNDLKIQEENKIAADKIISNRKNVNKNNSNIISTVHSRKDESKISNEETNNNNDIERNNDFNTESTTVNSSKSENISSLQQEDLKNNMQTEDDDCFPEISSSCNNRERVLPKWMMNPQLAKSGENTATKDAGSTHGENRKKVRISKTVQKTKKLHVDCSDDSENDQNNLPKKAVKVKKGSPKKPTNAAKKPNQYHTLSQDLDSPDFDTEIATKKATTINKNTKKPSENVATVKGLHSVVSDDEEDATSKNKVKKGSPKKPTNAAKKPNQYHTLSQDLDSPDFDTEIVTKKATTINKNTKKPSENVAAGKDLHSVSDDEEDLPSKGKHDKQKFFSKTNEHSSDEDEHNSKVVQKKEVKTPRKSCEYGEECYRKNPKHRKEMAHPGDLDYASHDENSPDNDDDDDRPECEYGVSCFRKNPQHRTSFKHTKKPQPPRNAKRKAKREGYEDDDSENEYDFDDPFLNDESSDDYAPTDSSGRDSDIDDAVVEDDTKRMMKEAKKFVKKRKH